MCDLFQNKLAFYVCLYIFKYIQNMNIFWNTIAMLKSNVQVNHSQNLYHCIFFRMLYRENKTLLKNIKVILVLKCILDIIDAYVMTNKS